MSTQRDEYTRNEQIASSASHAIGALLSLIGVILLIQSALEAGNNYQLASFTLYGMTLLAVYISSTLHHAIEKDGLQHHLRIFDHSSINLLITGTSTPYLIVRNRDEWDWVLVIAMWVITVIGIIVNIYFSDNLKKVSFASTALLGILCFVVVYKLWADIPEGAVNWIIAGGAVYLLGVGFYAYDKIRFFHPIWHLFVLGGSVCHYLGIFFYLA